MATPNNPAFANAQTAAIPASPASEGGGVVTPSAFDRLGQQGSDQVAQNASQLALTPYEYGLDPGGINQQSSNPTPQDLHPSAQRMGTSQWAGKTSQVNHAQAAEGSDNNPVWVTVPVDKVTTRGPISNSNAVYMTPKGYTPKPGESGGSIPPVPPAGRPYHGNAGFGTAW